MLGGKVACATMSPHMRIMQAHRYQSSHHSDLWDTSFGDLSLNGDPQCCTLGFWWCHRDGVVLLWLERCILFSKASLLDLDL